MQGKPAYIDLFIDALRFLAKLEKQYRKSEPNFDEFRKALLQNQGDKLKREYETLRSKVLQPLAETYVKRAGAYGEIARACHSVSHGFYETWNRTKFAESFPLTVTIGNVYYKEECIYNVSKSSIKRILNEGNQVATTLDVHVWLTLDDLTVIDLSIISSLIKMGKVDESAVQNPILIWREIEPSDFCFEPLLVDNNFFRKVDSGRTVNL